MRPIDADALKEALKEPILMDKERAEALWEGWHECTIAVDKAIDNAPTVEPERKKGMWKISYADHEAFGVKPFFRYCSECHGTTVHKYNFCPNCGADMRGEEI